MKTITNLCLFTFACMSVEVVSTTAFAQDVFGPTDFQSCTSTITFHNTNTGSLNCSATFDTTFNGSAGTFNEFFNSQIPGTIQYELTQDFDLNEFLLWNDRGAADSGIRDFTLTFRDNTTAVIGSFSGTATSILQGNNPVPEVFALGNVSGVRFVDLDIASSYSNNNTQVREVAFNVVPEPSAVALLGLLLPWTRRLFSNR